MMPRLSTVCLAGALSATALAGGVTAQCWEPAYGLVQATGDDALTPVIDLPFNFPLPGGGTTTQIRACTNGFIWLDPFSTSTDWAPTIAEVLSEPARVFAGWTDIDCDPADAAINGVYVNTSFASRAVITWLGNDQIFSSTGNNTVWMQVQLVADGSIVITHAQVDQYGGTSTSINHDMIVGVSRGAGALDPGEVDFSAGPVMGGTNPTIYEHFANPNNIATDPRDIGTIKSIRFAPNGPLSYNTTNTACAGIPSPGMASGVPRGVGCPSRGGRGFVFEAFTFGANDIAGQSIVYTRQPNGSYRATLTNSIIWQAGQINRISNTFGTWTSGTGDDSLSVAQPLGFSASYWDNHATSDVYIASNGRIYTAAGGDASPSPTVTDLNNGPCCIALWSADLDCAPSSLPNFSSGLYVDQYPGKCVVTFLDIPRWTLSPPNSERVTGQVQFFDNGDVIASIASSTITNSHVIGFFRGGQPGALSAAGDEIDLSTALPPPGLVIGVRVRPMEHDADLGLLGTTPIARATKLPTGALASVLHIGLDQTALPLDVIGMTGCTAYTLTIVSVLPMVHGTSDDASTSIGLIPNNPALIGGGFTTQALTLVPSINPLQIIASNGWDWVMDR